MISFWYVLIHVFGEPKSRSDMSYYQLFIPIPAKVRAFIPPSKKYITRTKRVLLLGGIVLQIQPIEIIYRQVSTMNRRIKQADPLATTTIRYTAILGAYVCIQRSLIFRLVYISTNLEILSSYEKSTDVTRRSTTTSSQLWGTMNRYIQKYPNDS